MRMLKEYERCVLPARSSNIPGVVANVHVEKGLHLNEARQFKSLQMNHLIQWTVYQELKDCTCLVRKFSAWRLDTGTFRGWYFLKRELSTSKTLHTQS